MQFQVPQFIETEDKVIGPLTIKQFGYIAAAGALSVLFFLILNLWLWFLLTLAFGGIGLALAFLPVNGRPLIVFLRSLLDNIWKPKIYVFKPGLPGEEASPEIASLGKISKRSRTPPSSLGPAPSLHGLKGLWQWLATSKTALPKRERPLIQEFRAPGRRLKEKYEIVRKLTGEREVARRVDYR